MSTTRLISLTLFAATLAAPHLAAAQNPTFTYGKADDVKDVKEVDWTATAEAGFVQTTGNSRTTTATATGTVVRVDPRNKLQLIANLTYARARIFIANDANGDGAISENEIESQTATSANAWQVKLRYDRFLTEFNSLYATGVAGADKPAGKDFVGGAQVGYSRRLYKSERHEAVAEVGYDFSYEDLSGATEGVAIHSARLFAGYKGTVRTDTAVEGSLEVLSNVNTLATVPEESGPLEDTRVNALAGVTSKLSDKLSLSVSFTAKYDNRPSPRPPLSIPYADGFVPLADKLDTVTKATLIVTFF